MRRPPLLLLLLLVVPLETARPRLKDTALQADSHPRRSSDNFEVLLDEIARKSRRRRKLSVHKQGVILAEALGSRNRSTTFRGHPNNPDVHNGIMDMLGRSTMNFS